jgi:hypothetical protein
VSNRLQSVTGRNLRLPTPVRMALGRGLACAACRCGEPSALNRTLGFQRREPRRVHRFEWESGLEPHLGRRVELSGGFQRPVALQLGAIALKTERLCCLSEA